VNETEATARLWDMETGEGKRVLVTGAAGFVGIPVTKALVERGFEVVALDNFCVGSRQPLEEALDGRPGQIVEADLRDAEAVGEAVAEAAPWGVVHLAALHFIPYCVAHPAEAVAVNVSGTQHLLDALLAAEPRRLVFASTADVYGPSETPHAETHATGPINVYGATKLMGEQLLEYHRSRQPGLESVVARMFNVYGPGETNPHVMPAIFDQLRTSRVLSLGNLTPRRDYIFVADMAEALTGLLTEAPAETVVNVGTGRATSVEELLRSLEQLLGEELEIRTDPARVRASDRPRLQASTGRLRSILPGLEPVALEDGLRSTLEVLGLLEPVTA
jgi:UDP-glucose 4-epimerase